MKRNEKITLLLKESITPDKFHHEFEILFDLAGSKSSSTFLSAQKIESESIISPAILMSWRKAYLWQYKAEISAISQHKQNYLRKALTLLTAAMTAPLLPFENILLTHTKAKLHGELGVVLRDDPDFMQLSDDEPESDESDDDEKRISALEHQVSEQFEQGFLLYSKINLVAKSEPKSTEHITYFKLMSTLGFDEHLPHFIIAQCLLNYVYYRLESLPQTEALKILKYASAWRTLGTECGLTITNVKQVDTLARYIRKANYLLNPQDSKPAPDAAKSKRRRSNNKKKPADEEQDPNSLIIADLSKALTTLDYKKDQDQFLRPYQKEALSQLTLALQSESPTGICHMPTGTGKTAVMSGLVDQLLKEAVKQQDDAQVQIIIIVPTLKLVDQTIAKFREYSGVLKTLRCKVGRWTGDTSKNIQPITVITQQSWVNISKQSLKMPAFKGLDAFNKNQDQFSWHYMYKYFSPFNRNVALLVDECHHMNAKQMKKILELNVQRAIVGFTASVKGYNLPYPIRFAMNNIDAIDKGGQCPQSIIKVNFSMFKEARRLKTRIGVQRGKELTKIQKEAIDSFLKDTTGINLTVLDLISQLFGNQKTMVFTNTKIHATAFCELAIKCGITAVVYHGDLNKEQLNANMRKFSLPTKHKDSAQLLISCAMVDEGFDSPETINVVDFSIYMKKERRMVQRFGRATRPMPGKIAHYMQIAVISGVLDPPTILLGNKNRKFYGCEEKKLIELYPDKLQTRFNITGADDKDTVKPMAAWVYFPGRNNKKKYGLPPEDSIKVESSTPALPSALSVSSSLLSSSTLSPSPKPRAWPAPESAFLPFNPPRITDPSQLQSPSSAGVIPSTEKHLDPFSSLATLSGPSALFQPLLPTSPLTESIYLPPPYQYTRRSPKLAAEVKDTRMDTDGIGKGLYSDSHPISTTTSSTLKPGRHLSKKRYRPANSDLPISFLPLRSQSNQVTSPAASLPDPSKVNTSKRAKLRSTDDSLLIPTDSTSLAYNSQSLFHLSDTKDSISQLPKQESLRTFPFLDTGDTLFNSNDSFSFDNPFAAQTAPPLPLSSSERLFGLTPMSPLRKDHSPLRSPLKETTAPVESSTEDSLFSTSSELPWDFSTFNPG